MMEKLIEELIFMPFLVGVIFMITAAVVYMFPPKKINYMYGYRTSGSMKSQARWDFAQKYSSIKMFQVGAALFAVSLLGFLFTPEVSLAIGFIMLIPAVFAMFYTTERALKKNFPNE